jgi:hypothetical protein
MRLISNAINSDCLYALRTCQNVNASYTPLTPASPTIPIASLTSIRQRSPRKDSNLITLQQKPYRQTSTQLEQTRIESDLLGEIVGSQDRDHQAVDGENPGPNDRHDISSWDI